MAAATNLADGKLAERVLEREKRLRGDRAVWESLWQSVARYCLPNAATFTEEVSPGVERTRWILDSTAPRALEMFASFLHTLLNSPSSQWVLLSVDGDPDIKPSAPVQAYLEQCQRQIMSALTAPSADIYAQLHQLYLDLGAFGTAVLFEDVVKGALRCRTYHLKDCVIAEGEDETVDLMFRQRHATRRQLLQRWDQATLGPDFKGTTPEKLDEKVRLLHAVFPATDPLADDLPAKEKKKKAPYYAAWVLEDRKRTILETGSYEEFPYFVPRWYKAQNEIYGRSQAMTALPDIRMVNRMSDTILRGAEKIVDPPLVFPDGTLVSPVRAFPGGITFTEGSVQPHTLIPPGTSRIETGNELLKNRQQAIKECFFTPLFVTPDSPVKTATQTLQEVDERNRALSPMLVRMQTELFSKFVARTYNLLNRSGQLPRPPSELMGKKLKVDYVSPLIASQKQMEALSISRAFEQLGQWYQTDQGIFDWIDTDMVGTRVPLANGVPADMIRTKLQVTNIRTERQKLRDQQQMAANAPAGATAAAALITAGAKRAQVDNAASG